VARRARTPRSGAGALKTGGHGDRAEAKTPQNRIQPATCTDHRFPAGVRPPTSIDRRSRPGVRPPTSIDRRFPAGSVPAYSVYLRRRRRARGAAWSPLVPVAGAALTVVAFWAGTRGRLRARGGRPGLGARGLAGDRVAAARRARHARWPRPAWRAAGAAAPRGLGGGAARSRRRGARSLRAPWPRGRAAGDLRRRWAAADLGSRGARD
jgi:hypothetical protein